jgi:hypothetical protein
MTSGDEKNPVPEADAKDVIQIKVDFMPAEVIVAPVDQKPSPLRFLVLILLSLSLALNGFILNTYVTIWYVSFVNWRNQVSCDAVLKTSSTTPLTYARAGTWLWIPMVSTVWPSTCFQSSTLSFISLDH